jgi:acetyl-CoA carboxylase biotin carboxyl carrier protein
VDINLEELKELIKLLKESNVAEFELRRADYRLRIKQGVVIDESTAGAIQAAVAPQPGNGQAKSGIALEPPVAQPPAPEENLYIVRSIMVGTFYRSSSPGSAAFVEVGDVVRKNQVLCIVEAMKIMNEIESDVDGEVRKIHAANGQPIEYGEPLFSIKPI